MASNFAVTVTGTEALTRRLLGPVDRPRGRALAGNTGLRNKDITPSIAIERATFSRQLGTLAVTGRRIPLIAFNARETSRGVTYRLPGGRNIVLSGFIATMRSGHRGVFRRASGQGPVNTGRRRGGRRRAAAGDVMVGRLPIVERFGPSLPHAFVRSGILSAMRLTAGQALQRNADHEIAYILSQRVPGGDE